MSWWIPVTSPCRIPRHFSYMISATGKLLAHTSLLRTHYLPGVPTCPDTEMVLQCWRNRPLWLSWLCSQTPRPPSWNRISKHIRSPHSHHISSHVQAHQCHAHFLWPGTLESQQVFLREEWGFSVSEGYFREGTVLR